MPMDVYKMVKNREQLTTLDLPALRVYRRGGPYGPDGTGGPGVKPLQCPAAALQ